MKTAEEILSDIYEAEKGDDLQLLITLNPSVERIKAAINQARKEALDEAAELAYIKVHEAHKELKDPAIHVQNSILNLKNEVK